jgi:hypothetical protein
VAYEHLECPHCGATGGLTMAGPEHYYCSHCGELLQRASQREAAVLITGFFCRCGAQVESQCRICRQSLCGECDVVDWLNNHAVNSLTVSLADLIKPENHLIVPVQRRGYLEAVRRDSKVWSIAHGRIGPAEGAASPLVLQPHAVI